jgi:TRAP-type C4-dicarboxylate transport system permease small subunit
VSAFIHIFDRIVDAVLVAALATISAVLVMQVVLRYFFNAALPWPEELSQFLLVLLSFLGMYRAIGKDQHIRIDWLPKSGQSPLVRGLRICGLLAVCVFLAYVGYGGWELAMTAWTQPSTALRLPMAIPYLIVPVACGLSLIAVGVVVRSMLKTGPDDSVKQP